FPGVPGKTPRLFRRILTGALHLGQPIARLWGRLTEGLTPWRYRGTLEPAPVWPVTMAIWSEQWRAPTARLRSLELRLRAEGACVLRGEEYDGWELKVRSGFLGAARLVLGIE